MHQVIINQRHRNASSPSPHLPLSTSQQTIQRSSHLPNHRISAETTHSAPETLQPLKSPLRKYHYIYPNTTSLSIVEGATAVWSGQTTFPLDSAKPTTPQSGQALSSEGSQGKTTFGPTFPPSLTFLKALNTTRPRVRILGEARKDVFRHEEK